MSTGTLRHLAILSDEEIMLIEEEGDNTYVKAYLQLCQVMKKADTTPLNSADVNRYITRRKYLRPNSETRICSPAQVVCLSPEAVKLISLILKEWPEAKVFVRVLCGGGREYREDSQEEFFLYVTLKAVDETWTWYLTHWTTESVNAK